MRDGRLVQAATPLDLYRSPVDPDVARFVGGATILPATVRSRDRHLRVSATSSSWTARPDGGAQVLVRPEQIRLDDPDTGTTKARVVEVSFYGHDAAVRLELLPDGPALVARIPGLDAPDRGHDGRGRSEWSGHRVRDDRPSLFLR